MSSYSRTILLNYPAHPVLLSLESAKYANLRWMDKWCWCLRVIKNPNGDEWGSQSIPRVSLIKERELSVKADWTI